MFRITLAGSRILLTGASSGIGWALAKELARHKARLILTARSTEQLDTLAKELKDQGADVLTVPGDVTDAQHRRRLIDLAIQTFGGLDILVNNAGVGASGFFSEAHSDRLRRIFEVNLFAAAELTRLALPQLRDGRNAMIVNISSVIGRRGVPGYSEYCASKFALCGWSEALRAELAPWGIHVCLINPGLIETPFRDHQLEDKLRFKWQKQRAMPADRCARQIVRAMRWRWNELVVTIEGKFLLWMNRCFPRFVDFLLAWYSRDPEVP